MRWLKQHWKRLLLGLALIVAAALAFIFWPVSENLSALKQRAAHYDARILRDEWGVPHIFGQTDADAAYGLAYAHAEDDFLTIQKALLAVRGQLASVDGADAAPLDYIVQLLRVWDAVNAKYETDLRPETRAVLEAYADGLNVYAATHPQEALPGLFPVTGKDIVAESVFEAPLLFAGLQGTLEELYKDTRQKNVSLGLTPTAAPPNSNVFAVAPSRTANGETFLAVNSHQPWTGIAAWYEAHIHSEEGWDMVGSLFPGSPVIIHGHNRNLGWAFTVNHPDLVDVFVLEINPDNPDQYRVDGEWLTLEKRNAVLTVKLIGNLKLPVTRETLWSVYGPVVRQQHGVYAIRYSGMERIGLWEQLYQMNKAQNLSEWQTAMATQQLPAFNVGYADKAGNLFYVYNALAPVRPEGYDWKQYLPGDTTHTRWTGYLPFDQLPQVLNPPSGFIQNANSAPYQTTLGAGNPDPADFSPTLGFDTRMSNRAHRLLELLGADDSITADEFYAIKYDLQYSQQSDVAKFWTRLTSGLSLPSAEAQAGLYAILGWDLQVRADSPQAALMVLTLSNLNDAGLINPSMLTENEVTDAQLAEAFTQAAQTLMKNFGRVDVPWGEVNRLVRGPVNLPLDGGPDIVRAIYGDVQADGRLHGIAGDSYIMLVTWDKDGHVSSQSLHQFGSATLDESSPHYADQAPLFSRMEMKPIWLDEADIRAHLEREYRPGE